VLNYALLDELNTVPRTTYLAACATRIRRSPRKGSTDGRHDGRPAEDAVETNRVLGPGQTSGGIDDVVNTPVLVGPQRTPLWWWIGFGVSGAAAGALPGLDRAAHHRRRRHLRQQPAGVVGDADHQLRLVDRDRPRRHADLGGAAALPPALAHLDQPLRRGDDDLRGRVRGPVPDPAPGPALGLLLAAPYPNTHGLFPNFRSPLDWDLFAISTYASVSVLFWYIGLIPDLATLRDSAKSRFQKLLYGTLALGWNGSAKAWQRYMRAYLLLAALSFPLVLSVHSTIAMDFAVSWSPAGTTPSCRPTSSPAPCSRASRWCSAGGAAAKGLHLEHMITLRHLDNAAKLMLATGMIVVYGYGVELFYAWYSGVEFEVFMAYNRVFGADHAWAFWR
jgi:hypothetical protein